MADVELWCRITLVGSDGSELACHALCGPGRPDMDTVDSIARAALTARRLGATVLLADVSPDLASLLDLASLRDLDGLVVEVEGQAERGEEALGLEEVEEELHPDDPAA
jgi:hypothetical protein